MKSRTNPNSRIMYARLPILNSFALFCMILLAVQTSAQEPSSTTSGGSNICTDDTIVMRASSKFDDLSDCMVKTQVHRSSAFRDPTYDEIRAAGLLSCGHLNEALQCYKRILEVADSNGVRRDHEWYFLQNKVAETYERLGKIEDALEHYQQGDGKKRVQLLVKLGRFKEALPECNKAIQEELAFKEKHHERRYGEELCDWLRLRGQVNAKLHQDSVALADFKEVAVCYAECDTKRLQEIQAECMKLLNKRLDVNVDDLPKEDADSVLKLLKFLVASSKPISTKSINQLAHSNLDAASVEYCTQSDRTAPSFYNIQYRTTHNSDPASALVQIEIWTDRCAIPKDRVMKALSMYSTDPAPCLDWFSDTPLTNAEVWKSKNGVLILSFGGSGYKVLTQVEWRGSDLLAVKVPSRLLERAVGKNEFEEALKLATNAIALEPNSSWNYTNRAKVYEKQGNLKAAIDDATSAVKYGGLGCLPRKIDLMLKSNEVGEAINELECSIPISRFERQQALLELLLANIYLKDKQYDKAITAAESCITKEERPDYRSPGREPQQFGAAFSEVEPMSAPAHVIKAEAEFYLGQKSDARQDADTAANEFYTLGQIAHRDKVLSWVESHFPKK